MTLPRCSRPLLPALSALLLVACGAPGDVRGGPDLPPSESGYLHVAEDGAPGFEACGPDGAGTGEVEPLRDESGEELAALVAELGRDGRVKAHLALEEGEPRVLREVRVAVPEAPGCDRVLPDAELQGRGNEPFWSLAVEGEALVWSSPEETDGVRHEGGRWVAPEADDAEEAWRFEAEGAWLELRAERCFDTMSGAWYPFSARAHREGRTYEGCGLEGLRAGA